MTRTDEVVYITRASLAHAQEMSTCSETHVVVLANLSSIPERNYNTNNVYHEHDHMTTVSKACNAR